MRVCLINAPTATEFSDPTELLSKHVRTETTQPQLGILSLGAVLEASGHSPRIVDLNREFFRYADAGGLEHIDGFVDAAAAQICDSGADVYGFGSICSGYPLTIRLAQRVKEARPNSVLLLGGPQASVVSEQTLRAFPFVDFVLRGEAERSLPLFLDELEGSRRFDRVPGLTRRSIWGIEKNPDAPVIADLDDLPSPAYHLTGELFQQDRASVELGRGCPFSCTFCSTNDFFRRKFRLRSPERVLEDMRRIESEYGIRDFELVHDMFTVDAKRVRAFCKTMVDSKAGYTWSCSARTDCVDEELIEYMAEAGCRGIFFGVETGSQRMQKIIDKHLDIERAHQIIDITERSGIRSTISLIMGFPEETLDDLRASVRMFMHSARTPRSGPQLNLLSPLANTPVHLRFKDRLTLDTLCSDISHQGRRQNRDDVSLIEKHPDVFPNFYLVPCEHLDRKFVLELREFMLMAEYRFRWLLGAVDQASAGILDVFENWLTRREELHPGLSGPDLRQYYRTPSFPLEFRDFLRTNACYGDPLVQCLTEFEDAASLAEPPQDMAQRGSRELNPGVSLEDTYVPVRTHRSRVVQLRFDLERAIEATQKDTQFEWTEGQFSYVVPQPEHGSKPILHVSHRVAMAARACNGSKNIRGVLDCLTAELSEIPQSWRAQFSEELLAKLWNCGLIAIFRAASDADESQVGGADICEYNSASALASRQNQSVIQAQ